MDSSPSAQEICKSFDSVRLAGFLIATLLGVPVLAIAQEAGKKSSSPVHDPVEKAVFSANWKGETSIVDGVTTAVCVGKKGWFICLVQGAPEEKRHFNLVVNGKEQPVEVLAVDPETGLCLFRGETSVMGESVVPLEVYTGPELHPGAELMLLGNRSARLAGKDREYHGETLPVALLRVHLSKSNRVQTGQPLFYSDGQVAGIITSRTLAHPDEVHAIPAARIAKLLEDYERNQRTGKIWIGASFHRQSTTPEVLVVNPNSPAAKAGLRPGDIVLKVDGHLVSNLPELAGMCETMAAGQLVHFEVLRHLETLDCKIVPQLAIPAIKKNSEK